MNMVFFGNQRQDFYETSLRRTLVLQSSEEQLLCHTKTNKRHSLF